MLIRVYDDNLLDVVRIRDEPTSNGSDGDRKSTKMEKDNYQNPTEDRDLLLIYLLERGN